MKHARAITFAGTTIALLGFVALLVIGAYEAGELTLDVGRYAHPYAARSSSL